MEREREADTEGAAGLIGVLIGYHAPSLASAHGPERQSTRDLHRSVEHPYPAVTSNHLFIVDDHRIFLKICICHSGYDPDAPHVR